MKTHIITSLMLLLPCFITAQVVDFELKDLKNNIRNYSELKGEKLTLIDFWATWCKPCKKAIPEWSFKYKSWNTFTTNSFIYSYEDLLESFKNLAFNKVSKRLMDYLKATCKQNNSTYIKLSHSQLAEEIGTTREVVSKSLKQFELAGIVNLKFKQIELLRKDT